MGFEVTGKVVAFLLGETLLVAAATFYLFYLRRRVGIGPLLVFLGSNQVLAVILAATIYFDLAPGLVVSPGSAVLFTGIIGAALLVYLREDIPKTRILILALAGVNLSVFCLLWVTGFQLRHLTGPNLLGVPPELFEVNPRVFAIGTVALLFDLFLIAILYEVLRKYASRIPRLFRVQAALVAVLAFDAVAFTFGTFLGSDDLWTILRGQLLTKGFFGLVWGTFIAGYLRWIEPVSGDAQHETGGFAVFSILTYRERIQLVKEELAAERAASAAKSRFLTHMSHELRTPLNSILGFTKLLLSPSKSIDSSQARLYLERVFANGQHLLHLINGILDLSRIEAGRVELELEKVSANEILYETVEQLRSEALAKNLRFDAKLPAEPVVITTDPLRLKQILINLIGNAIKFTDSGTIQVRLVADAPGGAIVDVEDTGIGIPASKIEEVFQAFTQADASLSRRHPGTGLGLAISRALCEHLGYTISVESKVGQGTRFRLHLSEPRIETMAS